MVVGRGKIRANVAALEAFRKERRVMKGAGAAAVKDRQVLVAEHGNTAFEAGEERRRHRGSHTVRTQR
jgi:hypothetical protein